MKIREYQELASVTMQCDMTDIELLANIMLGIQGESGEVAEHIKKGYFHRHGIVKVQLIEEIGDVLWYLAALATYFGVDLEEVAQVNIDKLRKRYPNGFSFETSKNRIDKKD